MRALEIPPLSHNYIHNHPHHLLTSSATTAPHSITGSSSPVAPAYSPLTPKVQPVLPANGQQAFVPPPDNGGNFTFAPPSSDGDQLEKTKTTVPPTRYIRQPPSLPFSGEDATDAIALRAAISTLQIQKKKAHSDIKMLSDIKRRALENPDYFKEELKAGRLREQKRRTGEYQEIFDTDSENDEVGEEHGVGLPESQRTCSQPSESQALRPPRSSVQADRMDEDRDLPFPQIPGPQNVVRMPHVNWEKYNIIGQPLDSMHEQQRRWPGSAAYATDHGREHAVAAPFSPFLDKLDTQHTGLDLNDARKDSAATASTPNDTVSEHPMETRSRH